jgi:hypothetical protein
MTELRRGDGIACVLLLLLAAGLSLPALVQARARAEQTSSRNNLRVIGRGMQAFVAGYGFFPGNGGPPREAATTPDVRTGFPDSEAFRWGYADPRRAGRLQTGCWAYSLLPFLGEEEAFREVDYTRTVPVYYLGSRRPVKPQPVPRVDPVYTGWTYRDAGLGPWGRTDYAANDQVVLGGMGNVMKPEQIQDGLAETALLAEKAMDSDAVRAGVWYWDEPIVLGGSGGTGRKGSRLLRDAPKLLEEVADNWGSPDPAGVWFLCCDGHTRLFRYDTSRKVIAALITPNGHDDIE